MLRAELRGTSSLCRVANRAERAFVSTTLPGYIPTDVSRLVVEAENAPEFVKNIPMRRFGELSDLDGPLLLLASDASVYMTGSVVVVDGGHICASL